MLFCDKCGSLLKPVDGQMKCECGFTRSDGIIKEKKKKEKKLEVVEKRETYPIMKQDCPKCGHDKAYHWSMQTRSSDEPPTLFFKCVKCSHQWRVY